MIKLIVIFLFLVFIASCILIARTINDKIKNVWIKTIANGFVIIAIVVVVITFVNFVFGT